MSKNLLVPRVLLLGAVCLILLGFFVVPRAALGGFGRPLVALAELPVLGCWMLFIFVPEDGYLVLSYVCRCLRWSSAAKRMQIHVAHVLQTTEPPATVQRMAKLHQILALEKGIKSRSHNALTDTYHLLQKKSAGIFDGLIRTYRTKDDEGDPLPSESKIVQRTVKDLLDEVAATLTPLIDVVLTKDHANTFARASITVDGIAIGSDVPVTTLLFLEKQLTEIRTVITRLPALDPSDIWIPGDLIGESKTASVETHRSQKVTEPVVAYPATAEHPAQVTLAQKDVVVGYWSTVKLSGALPQHRINELLGRVNRLLDAVKVARAEANDVDVADLRIGGEIFSFLFSD